MSIANVLGNVASQFSVARKRPSGFSTACFIEYLRIQARQIFAHRGVTAAPGSVRIVGAEVTCPNYGALLGLFKEIWLAEQYYFRTSAPAPLIIDAGANIGMAVLYFCKQYPSARVLAFEPDPTACAALKKNVQANKLNVTVHQAAVGGEAGEIDFFSDPAHEAGVSMSAHATGRLTRRTTVQCVCLSRFITEPVDLLKLDVEGSETEVLVELAASGKLELVQRLIVEFHEHKGQPRNQLPVILDLLRSFKIRSTRENNVVMVYAAKGPDEF